MSSRQAKPNAADSGTSDVELLLRVASELDATRIRQEALELEQRAREQRFYVACLGQFKRGKSTLLGALIDAQVLPTGILPVTAVPTIVRYGSEPAARIRLRSGEWAGIHMAQIEDYVSEEKNPENRKNVDAVEVFVNSLLLATGMCLVDTPGVGSIFQSNSQATRAFLPHVDAAIVVIGADPPLSAEELALVEGVSAQVKDLIFVLNKADRVTEAERRLASDFARQAFEARLHRPIGRILEISAKERLGAGAPTRDWPELVRRLKELALNSGAVLAQSAWQRGLTRLSQQLLAIIAERRGALTRPLEESQVRVARLRELVIAAQSSLRELSPLLTAEQQQMARTLADRRAAFS